MEDNKLIHVFVGEYILASNYKASYLSPLQGRLVPR